MAVSEEDQKLLDAFHSLTVKPKIDSTEDLLSFMKHMGKQLEHDETVDQGAIPKTPKTHHYPRISTFFGEENKGEVSWPTFKFEVEALISDSVFTEEQILLGIRRAVKGSASDVLRRLGIGVNIKEVMKKLQTTFGSIESEETILRKFYSCQQGVSESVSAFASRLEEMFTHAVALGGLKKSDDKILKGVFYQGLKPNIKQLAFSKCDLIEDYDRFKIEVRKIEADLAPPSKEEVSKCSALIDKDKKEKSELIEIKELLKKLNDRIDKLEEEKTSNKYLNSSYSGQGESGYLKHRGMFRGRGRYRGRYDNRNRGGYRPRRPIGFSTMQPTCFNCGVKGHIASNCPKE